MYIFRKEDTLYLTLQSVLTENFARKEMSTASLTVTKANAGKVVLSARDHTKIQGVC